VAAKKLLLTLPMVKKRLMFCKKYEKCTEEDWINFMFNDESMFRIVNSRGTTVRQPRTIDCYHKKYTVSTVKYSASAITIWGCFSGPRGRGGHYFLPKSGAQYVTVLENHLAPFMCIHGCTWFLPDGAPCHKSKVVMQKPKELEFQVMDWPGNPPDLNPIENCWSFMKAKLKEDGLHDHLAAFADPGNQDDVGTGATPGLLKEDGQLNAQAYQGSHGCQSSKV
jgi:hypothetical protein